MNICTWVIFFLIFANLGIYLTRHGELKKQEKYNFWHALIDATIYIALLSGAGLFQNQ